MLGMLQHATVAMFGDEQKADALIGRGRRSTSP